MAAEYLYLTYTSIQFLTYQQTKLFLGKTSHYSTKIAKSTTDASSPSSISSITTPVAASPFYAVAVFTASPIVQSYIAGATAGITATAATYPFDLLRTRFAIQQDVKVIKRERKKERREMNMIR
jgi:solute carrier family 25 thiamine pyrophosphate transporter 19